MSESIEYTTNATIIKYVNMINDRWRNEFFYNALKKHAAGKVVLDVGTGTGILAFYALSLGAKFVYCIEIQPDSADLTQRVLSKHFDQAKFKIIVGDFLTTDIDNQIDQKIDILVSETITPDLFSQGILNIWNKAKSFLAESAISIPDRLHFDVWVWEDEFLKPLFNNCELFLDEFIDENYAQALVEVSRELQAEQPVNYTKVNFRWETINDIMIQPSFKHYDVLSYTLDDELEFSNNPSYLAPKIGFALEVFKSSTAAIVGKMSFESDTRYIKDALLMPWKKNPVCVFPSAGKYSFVYSNLDYEPKLYKNKGVDNKTWICRKQKTKE